MTKIKLNKYVYNQSENSFICINNETHITSNKRINVLHANYMNKKNIKKLIDKNKSSEKSISLNGSEIFNTYSTEKFTNINNNDTHKHEKINIVNNFNTDLIYTINVQFGSNPLYKPSAELVIDTGSSDLWIAKRAIMTHFHKSGSNNIYSPNEKINKITGKKIPITITYGSGMVGGYICTDKVTINEMEINDQSFAIMNCLSLSTDINGIIGFGFSSLANKHNTPTFIDNLYEKKIIKRRIFGFNCNELSIGDIDEIYEKNMLYVPLYAHSDEIITESEYLLRKYTGHWALKYNGIIINNTKCNSIENNDSNSILIQNTDYDFIIADTGCSTIILSNDDYVKLVEYIGIDTIEITDETIKCLPDITFIIGDNKNHITLKPEHYIVKRNYGYDVLITGGADEIGAVIMGDPLFRAYYCVFDMDNKRMGFSPIVENKCLYS